MPLGIVKCRIMRQGMLTSCLTDCLSSPNSQYTFQHSQHLLSTFSQCNNTTLSELTNEKMLSRSNYELGNRLIISYSRSLPSLNVNLSLFLSLCIDSWTVSTCIFNNCCRSIPHISFLPSIIISQPAYLKQGSICDERD